MRSAGRRRRRRGVCSCSAQWSPLPAARRRVTSAWPCSAKVQHRARAGQLPPQRRERVVGREDGDARAAPSASIDRAVLARHGLDRGHELLVLALRVVDQRHGRRGDAAPAARSRPGGSCPARPRRRGAARRAGAAASAARRCGCSGCPRWRRPPSPGAGAQDRGDHLRHRGLAVAAGDGDQRQREARAPGRRQLLQRAPARRPPAGRAGRLRPGRARPAPPPRRPARAWARKSWRVEALAAQRDEQVAGAAGCACRCARARRRTRRRRPAWRRAAAHGPGPASASCGHPGAAAQRLRAPRAGRRTGA